MSADTATAKAAVLYPDLAVFLLSFLLALASYMVLRRLAGRISSSGEKAWGHFLSRLFLPAVFLLVALGLRVSVLREVLTLSPKFDFYLEAVILFFLAFFIIRFADAALFFWYQRRRAAFPLPRVLHGFILIVIYLAVLFAILRGILGINITPFLATSAILTMILGLAFQGVLSNVLAGMSLNFTRSFSRGDWVKIGPHEGVVLDTNWRETLLFDRAWNVIVIPNNAVAGEMITNFSRPDTKTALTISIKVSYAAAPAAVLRALTEAAQESPEVLALPPPQAFILGYDDFGMSYLLKFWVTDFSRKDPIIGEVGRLIWYKFQRNGIAVPVPIADQVKEVIEAVQEKKTALTEIEEKERNSADLLHSAFLRRQEGEKPGELLVAEDELRKLAQSVKRDRFGRGEVLFRQGDKGDHCYIVAKGVVRGEIIYEESGKRYTSEFKAGPGSLFGEMSLFTGMPRTATGIVEEDAELLRVEAEDFAGLITGNPGLAEVIAEVVSDRNLKNQEFLKKIKELSLNDLESGCSKKSIINRLLSLVQLVRKKG